MFKFLVLIGAAPMAAFLIAASPMCQTGEHNVKGNPIIHQECKNLFGASMLPGLFLSFLVGALIDKVKS